MQKLIAIDCEMVGGGNRAEKDLLAKVTLVDENGQILYDTYVKPTEVVKCYRTPYSGITKRDLQNAERFDYVQMLVKSIIKGNILVGHSIITSDLPCLGITHPEQDIRDTAEYPPFIKQNGGKTPSLKSLVDKYLKIHIQIKKHSSVEDAQAVMKLYKLVANEWERNMPTSH